MMAPHFWFPFQNDVFAIKVIILDVTSCMMGTIILFTVLDQLHKIPTHSVSHILVIQPICSYSIS